MVDWYGISHTTYENEQHENRISIIVLAPNVEYMTIIDIVLNSDGDTFQLIISFYIQ